MTTVDDPRIGAVLAFWFSELAPEDWFRKSDATDEKCRSRFLPLLDELARGVPASWMTTPHGAMAAVIVLDQFPRNIHRDRPGAFATDALALATARAAIAAGHDAHLTLDERTFLYMPFQHAEDLADQTRALELFAEHPAETRDFAQRHYDIIARFGRFPHRNAILGRESKPEELQFLEQPGSRF